MMVSAFLCQCHGLLRLPEELTELHPEIPTDSTVIMHPGANKDGYFTNEDLASQTRTMLIVFDVLHPGCTALVAYDNSSNHHAMANDALVASRINLKTKGNLLPNYTNGWFVNKNGALVSSR